MHTVTFLVRFSLALFLAVLLVLTNGCVTNTSNPGPRPVYIVVDPSDPKALDATAYKATVVIKLPPLARIATTGAHGARQIDIPPSAQPDSNPGPRPPIVLITLPPTSNPGPRPTLIIRTGPASEAGGQEGDASDANALILQFPKRFPFNDNGTPYVVPPEILMGMPSLGSNPGPRPN